MAGFGNKLNRVNGDSTPASKIVKLLSTQLQPKSKVTAFNALSNHVILYMYGNYKN